MRDRLLIFSTVQLLVFGALFAIAYWQFAATIVPTFERNLHEKAANAASALGSQLDVALVTGDAELATTVLRPFAIDPDFQNATLRTAAGAPLLQHGTPISEPFSGPTEIAHRDGRAIEAWVPITLEGVDLGAVSITYSTARIDLLLRYARVVMLVVAVIWLIALLYSVWFARSFVAPLRAMMRFARQVARGTVSERLAVDARDELRGLQEDLNAMASDLERREAERQRRAVEAAELQQALLVMSRTAGMAEVATNVLHNVGNVLNSLNVSVSVLAQQVHDSKVHSLQKLADTFAATPGGMHGYLETAKGKLVPAYLGSLAAHLAAENRQLLAELTSVTSNVEHIKTIIATQQSYAHRSGITEVVAVAPLIDDALRMAEVSFTRHGIEVVKRFDADVTIETDRHRLLEILINVVSNAKHALKDSGHASSRLTVELRRTEAGIAIGFADTGIGIAPENLDKIFRHGFTTKVDGHGFGLHACANAAQELGGAIAVTSAGVGQGAEFTITLPLQCPKRGSHDLAA